ncbi:MAG: vitamin K epoxide reductase family protein [FCB group bacterium]|nr:vitamin K epoxide reductase family protein [FCB group bacterium]
MTSLTNGFAALLAVAAGILSFYFFGIYSRWFSSTQKWVPSFCRMETQSCTSIVDSAYGRFLWGIPNAFWGIFAELGLAGIIVGSLFGFWSSWIPAFFALIFVAIGLWLIFGLIRLRVACPVCLTVHALNLIILILLIIG